MQTRKDIGLAEDRSLVNVTQIAALAGVGVSAVSNWRNRFDDFPQPVEGVPGGRDLFDLGEVKRWLRDRGRLNEEGQDKRLLYEAADALCAQLEATSMIEALGAALALVAVARRKPEMAHGSWRLRPLLARVTLAEPGLEDLFEPLLKLDPALASKVIRLIGEIDEESLGDCFEWLLTLHSRQARGRLHGISESQASLLTALVEEPKVVYDPAAGWGAAIRELWHAAPSSRKPELIGQEVNHSALRLARQRFLIEEIPVTLAGANSLLADAWPDLRVDAVVCSPPFGTKPDWPSEAADDPRWRRGLVRSTTDLAWLQHCLHHLQDDGRAFVFLPAGTLFRGGPEAEIRARLLEEGLVEAVFSLPPGSALSTSLPLVLWILRRSSKRGPVLLVDLAASPSGKSATDPTVSRVASIWGRWQAKSLIAADDFDIAAVISTETIVEAGANLVPTRWINHDPTPALRSRQERDFENLERTAQSARAGLRGPFKLPPPAAFTCTGWIPVKQLAEEDRVEFVKGVHVNKKECGPEGIPVLRTVDLRHEAGGRLESGICFLGASSPGSMPLTKPGDVILSPASGSLRAAVDHEGGRLLARPLQGLRILDKSLDPEVAAVFLEAARNSRFVTGSAYARISLRDLELPILDHASAEALRQAVVQLREQEQHATDLANAARELRQQVANLTTPIAGEGVIWTRSR